MRSLCVTTSCPTWSAPMTGDTILASTARTSRRVMKGERDEQAVPGCHRS